MTKTKTKTFTSSNVETLEALQQAYDGENLTEYESLDALKASHC